MATAWETFPIYFNEGLRTDLGRLEQGMQAPGSAIVLRNFEPSVEGGYAKIMGYEKYSDTEITGTGPILFVAALNGSDCIARRGDSYYFSSGTTWTSKLTATTTGASKIHYDRFNFDGTPRLVVVDGYEDPAFYNTATGTMAYDTAAPASVTGASIVKVFKNHIFFAKDNLLSFTAPFTTDDYDPGNGSGSINIGDTITGLIVFRDRLIVFSKSSIQSIVGSTSSDFTLQPIADNTGCLCSHSVQEVGGDIMYLGPDGVRWLSATERNNDFGLEKASSNIQSEINRALSSDCMMTSITIRAKNQYRLFFYDSTQATRFAAGYLGTVFGPNDQNRIKWSELRGLQVYSADNLQMDTSEIVLFGNSTGYVYKMEVGSSFDGADINAVYQTPYIPINDPRFRKTMYKHSLYATIAGRFETTCSLKFDYEGPDIIQPPEFVISVDNVGGGLFYYGSPDSLYGTATYSKAVRNVFVDNVRGSGLTVSIRYENESDDPQFLLSHALLEYRTNERR